MDERTMPDPGRDRYRRGQRRRARIAWAVVGLMVVAIGLAIAFGGNDRESSDATSVAGLLPAEMSASAYTAIHKGQTEVEVLGLIGVAGQHELRVLADQRGAQPFGAALLRRHSGVSRAEIGGGEGRGVRAADFGVGGQAPTRWVDLGPYRAPNTPMATPADEAL